MLKRGHIVQFYPITLDDKPLIKPHLDAWHCGNSESSFANLMLWSEPWTIQYALEDDVLFVRLQYKDGTKPPLLFAPLAKDDKADYCQAMNKAISYFEESGYPFVMKGVTKPLVDYIRLNCSDIYDIEADANYAEYIYSVPDLMELAGKKYHGKRNHINRFLENNPEHTFALMTEADVPECKALYEKWVEGKEEEIVGLSDERSSVMMALNHFQALDLIGGIVRIDGNVEAFTLGERVLPDMALIHIEKANWEIQGLYPFINREFLRHAFADCAYVNREEDMGIDGLRKAKLSYKPVKLLEKYIVSFA